MKRLESHLEIAELIGRFLEGKLSAEESECLEDWIAESEEHQQLFHRLTDLGYLEGHLQDWRKYKESKQDVELWRTKLSNKKGLWRTRYKKILQYAAVALVILTAGFTGWFFWGNASTDVQISQSQQNVQLVKIMPRGKVAQLILGNGNVVNLNDSVGKTLTEKDGTKVRNGKKMLHYIAGSDEVKSEGGNNDVYNTLVIPRGGEYQVTLSDGTKVWLNAASSLRYPTQFEGRERRVFLSGEGYFEVAKDEQRPFIVESKKTRIKVLGTKFNVSAYDEDPTERIALAEGKVRVGEKQFKRDRLLTPGFGMMISKSSGAIKVQRVNIEAVLAWKNGMFIFDGESLGSIMKKLSRWYDIGIKYENGVDTMFHFTGRIQRYEEISGILHLIELTGRVKFEVAGSDIIVRRNDT